MMGTTGNGNYFDRNPKIVGLTLLVSGPIINYLLERHNIFKVWENSAYPISWSDVFYPPLCVFLSLTGMVLAVGGAISRTTIRKLRPYALAIVIPLTLAYTLFTFAMQFIATGADRLGECPGLDQAAASSSVIPKSEWRPSHLAVGCGVERRGIFLSSYNDIWVYGVTESAAQQRVLDRVAEHFRQARTHPVQVVFLEKENWTVRQGKNGATFGSGRPSKLIRIVTIE
jgi:hypothetical protein